MNYKILSTIWFTPSKNGILFDAFMGTVENLCIGIVAIESYRDPSTNEPQWKCYIGYGNGLDEDRDAQHIATHGMPLGNQAAASGFFPELPAEGYRY